MKYRTKKSELCYFVAYVLFVFSWFNRDVENIGVFYLYTNIAKNISLLFLIIGICCLAPSKRQIKWFLLLLSFDVMLAIRTETLFFIIIALFAYLAIKMPNNTIIKIAFEVLLFFTIGTIILVFAGAYSDVITRRWANSAERHSFGFYHSNVLPLVFSYLVAYYLLLTKHRDQRLTYMLIFVIDILLYHFCGSRNAFLIVILLIASRMYSDSNRKIDKTLGRLGKGIKQCLYIGAGFCVWGYSLISFILPYLVNKHEIWKYIDYITSFRFTYIHKKMQILGVGLMPKMTNKDFFSNQIVIDNGFAYVLLRYGILTSFLLGLLVFMTAKRYRDNIFVLMVIIIISTQNFIDNDIFDYSCLPFIIIGIKCSSDVWRERKNARIS